MKIKFTFITLVVFFAMRFNAQVIITQNFNNPSTIASPASGWVIKNNSSPTGLNSWFAGNVAVFPAFSSPDSSYIAANYNNTNNGGTISNWLLTPTVTLSNGGIFQFATRTNTAPAQSVSPDRLQLYMSLGTGVDVGTTSSSVGTFSLITSVNPSLTTTGYPTVWTVYTTTISGVTGTVTGRFAFRYFVPLAGPTGVNSSYIGIDNVRYELLCPNPTLTISSPTAGICSGNTLSIGASGATTYTWSSGQNTPTVTLSPSVTTIYTLTGSSTPNCNSTGTVAVTVTLTPNLAVSNITTCPGTAATLAASGASSYSWSTGSSSATIVDTPTINTSYTVTGFNGVCSSSNVVSVAIGASLSIYANAQQSLICSGRQAVVFLNGASNYSFTSGSPTLTPVAGSVSFAVSPGTNTTYTVNGSSGTCLGSNTILVSVIPSPTLSIAASSNSAAICAGTSITFTISGAASYSWTSNNSISSVLTVITPSTSGVVSYPVVGTGTNGCSTNTTITRTIDLCTSIETLSANSDRISFYPNPFTNELKIAGLSSGSIKVYNALGQMVLSENNVNDSSINTSDLPKGIYIMKAFSEKGSLINTVKMIKN